MKQHEQQSEVMNEIMSQAGGGMLLSLFLGSVTSLLVWALFKGTAESSMVLFMLAIASGAIVCGVLWMVNVALLMIRMS